MTFTDDNILPKIRTAIQNLSVKLSSSEEQYDLNKSVHLEIPPDPNSDKVLYKIDPGVSRGVRTVLLNTITEIAAKNKISVSSY